MCWSSCIVRRDERWRTSGCLLFAIRLRQLLPAAPGATPMLDQVLMAGHALRPRTQRVLLSPMFFGLSGWNMITAFKVPEICVKLRVDY